MNTLRDSQGERIGTIIRHEWADDGVTLFLDAALENIRQEIAWDYEAGKVKPFREGESIGELQHLKKNAVIQLSPAQRWEHRQSELRALREKNDRAIARILGEG